MRKWIFAGLLVLIAGLTMGPQINTSGRCSLGQDCDIGDGKPSGITLNTDGGDLNIDGTTGNALTLTATTTASPTFIGADAATPADTIFDTTGTGTVQVGSADVTAVILTTDGLVMNLEGTTANALTLAAPTTASPSFVGADASSPADTIFDTTGAGTVQVGSADVTGVTLTTDGASLNIEGTTANTLTLTSATTGTMTIMGADAAGASNLTIDTSGAGAIAIGSADVTAVTVITDGGTVTIDGYVQADVGPFITLASGNLTANSVHLATASATYTLPTCVTANIGEWVTVVAQDVNEVLTIDLVDASNTISMAGAIVAQGDEIDSEGHATTGDGEFITLVCVVAEFWMSTAIGGVWIDGAGN